MKQVLTIIPTYNEAENIEKIVALLLAQSSQLGDWVLSILIVDDNSPDGTADIVRQLQQRRVATSAQGHLHLISGNKAGLGKAYLRGFEEGLRQDTYDAFIMMDADLSHNPASIPSMLAAIDNGADYVIGSRYVHGGTIPGNWPLLRILNSRVANFVAHVFTDIDKTITDVTGGFKAIRVSALQKIDLKSIAAAGYVFQVSLVYEFSRSGAKIREVPITFIDRQFGNSKLKKSDVFEFLHRAYRLNPDSRISRLVRFGFVGLSGTLINLAVLTVLVRVFDVSVFIAVAVAIEASIITNFFMNHYFTFQSARSPGTGQWRDNIMAKLLLFNVGALGGALISYTVFAVLHARLDWNYIIADIGAILLAMSWNYWMSTKIVWKTNQTASPESKPQVSH